MNTNVNSLPTISQLQVQNLASKCGGECGACLFCQSCASESCAVIISNGQKEN